ncbi:MAG: hypothetical protein ACRYG7_46240 [Janthinobacterium lividum]
MSDDPASVPLASAAPTSGCPWWRQALSWARRHVALALGLGLFPALLFGAPLLYRLVYAAHGVAPVQPGGPDPDGAQVAAAQQAGGWVQLGALTSKLGFGLGLFFLGIATVWFTLGLVVPALPSWAKKDYKTTFLTLPDPWKITVYSATWLALLFFFARCMEAASTVQ